LLLERLSPEERADFLLHRVFEYSQGETAKILGIGEDACRQRAHRARLRMRGSRPRFGVNANVHRRLLNRFVEALAQPSLEPSAPCSPRTPSPSATGVRSAASLHPCMAPIAWRVCTPQIGRRLSSATRHEFGRLNGILAVFWVEGGAITVAMWIDTDGTQITAIHAIRHPGKPARLEPVTNSVPVTSLE